MPRALISGFSGFVGSHLAEYLLKHTDWEIWGLMRWNEPLDNVQSLVSEINKGGRVKIVYGDLIDPLSLCNAVYEAAPKYIFHLAAQSYVSASLEHPVETLTTNGIGTLNLLQAARIAPNPWVHICSSSEVYGRMDVTERGITEDQPLRPASPYSISKMTADMLGQYYAQAEDLNVIVTRMFTHTGPRRGDVFMESSFAKQIAMIEAGLMEPPIKVGNLEAVRTIADVRDAVRAYHMALTVNPQRGEVYNIGGNYTCTAGDVLKTLCNLAGIDSYYFEPDGSRMRPIDADHQVPDCSKFKKHTGWKPEISFRQTMQDLLDCWREKVKHGVPLQR